MTSQQHTIPKKHIAILKKNGATTEFTMEENGMEIMIGLLGGGGRTIKLSQSKFHKDSPIWGWGTQTHFECFGIAVLQSSIFCVFFLSFSPANSPNF